MKGCKHNFQKVGKNTGPYDVCWCSICGAIAEMDGKELKSITHAFDNDFLYTYSEQNLPHFGEGK